MPAKSQNTYASIIRELNLQGVADDFELHGNITPVVVLHEHCEGERFGTGATLVGIGAAGDFGAAVPIPHAGSYQISYQMQVAIAVALVGTAKALVLTDRPMGAAGGSLGRTLALFYFGPAGLQAYASEGHMAKIHFQEGREVVWVQTVALLANDLLSCAAVFQPV